MAELHIMPEGIIRHFPVPDPTGSPLKGATHD